MISDQSETMGAGSSEAWDSIKDLSLRLSDNTKIFHQALRGQEWLILSDAQTESYYRCSIQAEAFLRALNGIVSVNQAYLNSQDLSAVPLSRQDIVVLIGNLKSSGLLATEQAEASEKSTTSGRILDRPWLRPFAIKFALFDPDSLLQKTVAYTAFLFTWPVLLVWLLAMLYLATQSWLQWDLLVEHGQSRFSDPSNLLWYWLIYPVLKSLHEFGHAYATRVRGGAVHEMGIMLLVFFPVPYVNCSSANRFHSKTHRMLVSAMGIMVELFFAALAFGVWAHADPGLIKDLAFDVVFIGSFSTLVFNANPLLRFDGYYLLSEWIEIPNLGSRSKQYLAYVFKRYVLALDEVSSPVTAVGERKWFVLYGVTSTVYRFFISLWIALWVAGKFFVIGFILAIWAIVSQIVMPTLKAIYQSFVLAKRGQKTGRYIAVALIFLMLFCVGLFYPMGYSTYAEGIISLPENALLRASTDGVVTQVRVKDGSEVAQNQTIIELENLQLVANRQLAETRLSEIQAQLRAVFLTDRGEAEILKSKSAVIQAELADYNIQVSSLKLKSQVSGRVYLPNSSDMPGSYIRRGDIIGYVVNLTQVKAKVVIPQSRIEDIRRQSTGIWVRLESRPDQVLQAEMLREIPLATDQLPSRYLGTAAGGKFETDMRQQAGTQSMFNTFQVEILLPEQFSGHYLGQRIHVKFTHQKASLFNLARKYLTQVLLSPPFV